MMKNVIALLVIFGMNSQPLQGQLYYSATKTGENGKIETELFDEHGEPVFDRTWDFCYLSDWNWIIAREGEEIVLHDSLGTPFGISGVQDVFTSLNHAELHGLMIDSLWGFYDRNCEIVVPHLFNQISIFIDGKAAVETNGEVFYIDRSGKKLDQPYTFNHRYSLGKELELDLDLGSYSSGYEVFDKRGKQGLKKRDSGQVVLDAKFDYLGFLSDNTLIAQLGVFYGVIDYEGNLVIPFEYDGVSFFEVKI